MAKKKKVKKSTRGVGPSVKRQFCAGGVVFKKRKGDPLFLLAKTSPSEEFPKSVWRLPKGLLDDERTDEFAPGPMARGEKKATENDLQDAAKREVREEGGVDAKVVSKVGTETYFPTIQGNRYMKFVTFFLMEWQKDLLEGFDYETSETTWLSYNKARRALEYEGEKRVLDKAKKLLDSGIQGILV